MAHKPSVKDPLAARKLSGTNQSEFWGRFSVTQSGGSRYESGRKIPVPTALLMQLYFDGTITDADLENVKKKINKR